jgi:Aspartyl/Asparaginyl beta-hydroxylase
MELKGFYDLERFPQFKVIQENYAVIVEEFQSSPLWVKWGSDDYSDEGDCMFLKGDWKVCPVYFGLYKGPQMHVPDLTGLEQYHLVNSLPECFPRTTQMLKNIRGINFAAFSRLYAHSELEPHRHVNPLALIYHMGIEIPKKGACGLKVGGDIHIWREVGDVVIFDDTFEHSAWNHSDEDRIIFYMSFIFPKHTS